MKPSSAPSCSFTPPRNYRTDPPPAHFRQHERLQLPLSDLEEDEQQQRQHRSLGNDKIDWLVESHLNNNNKTTTDDDQLGRGLSQFLQWLDGVDDQMDDWEERGVVGPAIVRGCADVADLLNDLATQLEQQTQDERWTLAQTCWNELQQQQQQQQQQQLAATTTSATAATTQATTATQALVVPADLTETDFVRVMEGLSGLLRDMEATLRSIDDDEAQELAHVALHTARVLLESLTQATLQLLDTTTSNKTRNVISTTTSSGNTTTTTRTVYRGGVEIEEFVSMVNGVEIVEEVVDDETGASTTRRDDDSEQATLSRLRNKQRKKSKHNDRLSLMVWPRLGPKVGDLLHWGKDEAAQRPLLAVVLGLALWPGVFLAALWVPPLVLVDGWLHDAYAHFHDAPLLVGLERGAAHVGQTAQLALVSTKLVVRQVVRLAQKQLDRHGGPEAILHQCAGWTLDRVTHPVESLHHTWNAVAWSTEQVVRILLPPGNNEEEERAAQELQV